MVEQEEKRLLKKLALVGCVLRCPKVERMRTATVKVEANDGYVYLSRVRSAHIIMQIY
jgi:hypothetical protein